MRKITWKRKVQAVLAGMMCCVCLMPSTVTVKATVITTDPAEFYWSKTLGNEGSGVIDYEGEIYWCNRAYLASSSSTDKYDNLGWYVQMKNKSGDQATFYAEESSCLIAEKNVDGYGYYLYKIEKEMLIEAVSEAGYNLADYFAEDVTVELDGNVRLHNGGVTFAGPYDLRSSTNLTSLLAVMASRGFSAASQASVKTEYVDKKLIIVGTDILIAYQVEYNSNTTEEVKNMPTSQSKVEGTDLVLSDNIPIRIGYVFKGWGSIDNIVGYQPGELYKSDASLELYAIWEPINYSIEFNGNQNTSGSTSAMEMIYGVSESLNENGFNKTGYQFLGWSNSSDGQVLYTDKESVKNLATTNGETVELYAKWTANSYYIVFDGNGNTSGTMSDMSITYDDSVKLTKNSYAKTGYSFAGWGNDEDGEIQYLDQETVKNLTNQNEQVIKLFAQWDAYPVLEVADVYMYLEDELDEVRIYKEVVALDEEDGDITESVVFNQEDILLELEELRNTVISEDMVYEIEIDYSVKDSFGNEVIKQATLHVYAFYNTAYEVAQEQAGYVRFISSDYMDTLEENSYWRESETFEYLKSVLNVNN